MSNITTLVGVVATICGETTLLQVVLPGVRRGDRVGDRVGSIERRKDVCEDAYNLKGRMQEYNDSMQEALGEDCGKVRLC